MSPISDKWNSIEHNATSALYYRDLHSSVKDVLNLEVYSAPWAEITTKPSWTHTPKLWSTLLIGGPLIAICKTVGYALAFIATTLHLLLVTPFQALCQKDISPITYRLHQAHYSFTNLLQEALRIPPIVGPFLAKGFEIALQAPSILCPPEEIDGEV